MIDILIPLLSATVLVFVGFCMGRFESHHRHHDVQGLLAEARDAHLRCQRALLALSAAVGALERVGALLPPYAKEEVMEELENIRSTLWMEPRKAEPVN